MKEIATKVKFPSGVEMDFVFSQDDAGHWTADSALHAHEAMLQEDVIDLLRRSPEWETIRRHHFPMFGFSS